MLRPEGEAHSLWRALSAAPPAARWLGYFGLIPFLACAAGGLFAPEPWKGFALRALLAYGAVILSFLGGVRWGVAISKVPSDRLLLPLFVSILPSIAGWAALFLGGRAALMLLATSLAVLFIADLRLVETPAWYRALRIPLSIGAIASMMLGAAI